MAASTVSNTSHVGNYASSRGTYVVDATPAATTLTLGYKPNVLIIWNETDGDKMFFHINGMADASHLLINDSGSNTTDLSIVASDGITLSDTGVSIGTDSNILEASKTYRYFASL